MKTHRQVITLMMMTFSTITFAKSIMIDVGHNLKQQGTVSAYGDYEFNYNRLFVRDLYKTLKPENDVRVVGYDGLTEKLEARTVNTANYDLFMSIHHDAVQPQHLKKWIYNGQEQIYNEIRTKLSDATTKFIALTGSAGTGKTLLTYHIAKESIRKGEKVLILHCAPLNSGHKILMEEYGWSIHMPKYAPNTTDFDLIIIDEAQRMYPYQFDKYIEEVRTFNKKCIFSYDENQYLRDNEKN